MYQHFSHILTSVGLYNEALHRIFNKIGKELTIFWLKTLKMWSLTETLSIPVAVLCSLSLEYILP